MRSARELFEHETQEAYDGADRLQRALECVRTNVSHPELSSKVEEFETASREQHRRLEEVFSLMGQDPKKSESRVIRGYVESFTSFLEQDRPEKEAIDVEAAEFASDVAEYLMQTYEAMPFLAERSGVSHATPKIADLLKVSGKEGKKLGKDLKKLLEPLVELLPAS